MAAVIGRRISREERADAVKLPRRARKDPPFVFKHHPKRWFFSDERQRWLPQLAKIVISPGIGGVGEDRSITRAHARAIEDGWTVIMPSDQRLGDYKDYTQAIPHSSGGSSVIDMFQGVEVEFGQAFYQEGGDAYLDFLAPLVKASIVPPMSKNVLRLLMGRQRELVDRLENQLRTNPSNEYVASRLNTQKKRQDLMMGKKPRKAAKS